MRDETSSDPGHTAAERAAMPGSEPELTRLYAALARRREEIAAGQHVAAPTRPRWLVPVLTAGSVVLLAGGAYGVVVGLAEQPDVVPPAGLPALSSPASVPAAVPDPSTSRPAATVSPSATAPATQSATQPAAASATRPVGPPTADSASGPTAPPAMAATSATSVSQPAYVPPATSAHPAPPGAGSTGLKKPVKAKSPKKPAKARR